MGQRLADGYIDVKGLRLTLTQAAWRLTEDLPADTEVATAAFWQGVDVPGRALRLVIIDKLPFDVPSDPLIAARCERLEQQGIQPFMRYLVPSAALTVSENSVSVIKILAPPC